MAEEKKINITDDNNEGFIDAAETSFDDALLPFAQFVSGLSNVGESLRDERMGIAMTVENIAIDLPVELEIIVDENGKVALAGAPPTQQTETTILPVLHQLRINLVSNNGE